jgi:membrane-associated phospholipid phosphatase
MVLAGSACLAAAVLIGLAAQRRGTWLDHATLSAAGRLVSPKNRLVRLLSSEAGWPHAAYLTALLPVAVTVAFQAGGVLRDGVLPVIRRWRWVLLTLTVIPAHYVLRVAFRRPGPDDTHDEEIVVGGYPSGAALAVGLGWTLLVVVVGGLRPRYRPLLLVMAVVVLVVHAIVRALTRKHWATDIVGSYLLVVGAFLLASTARPDASRPHPATRSPATDRRPSNHR